MKALVLKEYNHFTFEDVASPEIGPDDVLIKVEACGICGSDVHGMDGSTGRRIPPLIMGHEAAGIIADTGKNVGGYGKGDRVTFDSTIYCGTCHFCRSGQINLCENRRVLGVSCSEYRQNGAFAEYVAVPSHILYRLPESLTFERAALVEPLSIAFHAVELTPVRLNDYAVVVGAGIIGLFVIQLLRVSGCKHVIAVDLDQNRLDIACTLGADEGFKPNSLDVIEEIFNRTEGMGVDIAFEAVGLSSTVNLALNSLKKGGALTVIGNLSSIIDLPLQTVVVRQIALQGSCASSGEYPACLDMIARGDINVDALTSVAAPLVEGASWFDRLYRREPGLMKVVLVP